MTFIITHWCRIYIFHLGYSDEEYETDPETKVRGPKPPKDGSEDSDVSVIDYFYNSYWKLRIKLRYQCVIYNIIEAFVTLLIVTFELFVF